MRPRFRPKWTIAGVAVGAVGLVVLAVLVSVDGMLYYNRYTGQLRRDYVLTLHDPRDERFVDLFVLKVDIKRTPVSVLLSAADATEDATGWVYISRWGWGLLAAHSDRAPLPLVLFRGAWTWMVGILQPLLTEEELQAFVRASLDPDVMLADRLDESDTPLGALEEMGTSREEKREILFKAIRGLGCSLEPYMKGEKRQAEGPEGRGPGGALPLPIVRRLRMTGV